MRRGRTPIHSVSYRKAPPLGSVRIYSVLESENRHRPAKTLDADAVRKGKKNKSKRMRCGNDVLQFPGLRGRNPPQPAASQPPYDWWTCTGHKRPNESGRTCNDFNDIAKLVIFCNCFMD